MFGPRVLETITSPINGNLEVRRWGKDIYVTTGGLTQSGGLIKELWEKTLKRIKIYDLRFKSWLILGLATGTLAKIISAKYSPSKIVGVELDPAMIRIGQKYFGLDNISNLQIIKDDAKKYVFQTKERFEIVIVDLYVGDQLPKFVYTPKFIRCVKTIGDVAVFNHLFYDDDKRSKARLLSGRVASIFSQIQLIRELTNLLIICTHD